MEWFLSGVAGVSAVAAVWSAVSAHRSALEAKETRRPYIAITKAQLLEWTESDGRVSFSITNAGPIPGRVTGQHSTSIEPAGNRIELPRGVTKSNVIYPVEAQTPSFWLPITLDHRIEIVLEYEDIVGQNQYRFEVTYLVHSGGGLEIERREAT